MDVRKLLPSGAMPIIAEGCLPYLLQCKLGDDVTVDNVIDKEKIEDSIRTIFTRIKDCECNVMINDGSFRMIDWVFFSTSTPESQLPAIVRYDYATATPYSALFGLNVISNMSSASGRVLGWNVMDEPTYYNWGSVFRNVDGINPDTHKLIPLESWNGLSMGYRMCREFYPDKLAYWTLAVIDRPEKGSGESEADFQRRLNTFHNLVGTCDTYEEYLDVLQKLYRPDVWAYDVYPVTEEKTTSTKDIVDHHRFYKSLRMFAEHSRKTGKPFWAYGMILAHSSYDNIERPTLTNWKKRFGIPTKGVLRFELFNSLACGAKGVVYYKFGGGWNPEGPQWWDKRPDFFTIDAAFTAWVSNWNEIKGLSVEKQKQKAVISLHPNSDLLETIKKINFEIRELQDVFMQSELESMYQIHQYNAPYYDGIPQSHGLPREITVSLHECMDPSSASRGVLLTSLIRKKGGDTCRYVVIVSHDPFYAQTLEITFVNKNYTCCNKITYSKTPPKLPAERDWDTPASTGNPKIAGSGYYILPAGGYVIFEEIL